MGSKGEAGQTSLLPCKKGNLNLISYESLLQLDERVISRLHLCLIENFEEQSPACSSGWEF